jgi:hypothetical protein
VIYAGGRTRRLRTAAPPPSVSSSGMVDLFNHGCGSLLVWRAS